MRTRHPSNSNTPDQEAARVFEATLKRHVQENPDCQWELDWFKGCLKKVRRSRKLIDEQLAKSGRPLCDKFVHELARDPAHLDAEITSPRSSLLLDHLPEEHEHDLAKSIGDIADQVVRPRPGSLSPQISPRTVIPGTPYDEPPSATSSVAPTPKVPGAFFASVQSLVPSNGSSPAMRPDVIEPGPPPEPLPRVESNHPYANVPENLLAPDDPTPRFERESPFDQPEIPRVQSVSPHTSFPGDVPNQDAFPIYSSTDVGDVRLPNLDDVHERRPNPLRLPGAYAQSEHSITPSQSVEDLTTPIDNKTPTETPITPGLELDLFPKPPALTVPLLTVPSGSSGQVLSPISPKVPGAYAPSIFDATPAMDTVPLDEAVSPYPALEPSSDPLDASSPDPVLERAPLNPTADEAPSSPSVDDDSVTPVREQPPTNPISRTATYNPILAGQTTNRVSRSFPIDETALDGQTPTTEPSSPFVVVPHVEQTEPVAAPKPVAETPEQDEPVPGVSPTDTWEHVSPSDGRLDSVSPSHQFNHDRDGVAPDHKEPEEHDAEISPASVPVVDVRAQAQDEALPVQDVASVPETVHVDEPAAEVQEQVEAKSGTVDSTLAPELQPVASVPKTELLANEPATALPAEDTPRLDSISHVSAPSSTSEAEPHPAPPVELAPETKPGDDVEQDEAPTTISDSAPRPELDSATWAESEVARTGEIHVAKVEPVHAVEDGPLVEPTVEPEIREVPAAEGTSSVTRTEDIPATTVVTPVQQPAEPVSDPQDEKIDLPRDEPETRSIQGPEVQAAPQPDPASLPQKEEEPKVETVPVAQPVTAPPAAKNLDDTVSSDVRESEPAAGVVVPEVDTVSEAADEPAVQPSADMPATEEAKEEPEQIVVAEPKSTLDALPVEPVVKAIPVPAADSVESSVGPSDSAPFSDDQVVVAQVTTVTASSDPPEAAGEAEIPDSSNVVPALPVEVVVEQRETPNSDSNSIRQPETVADTQSASSESTKLGVSALPELGPEADDHVESAHDSDSTVDSDSVHTPPATVSGSAADPTVRAKELSQEAGQLSEKFAEYGDLDDLDGAIELYGQVAELLAPNSEDLDVSSYLDLGRMMRLKFEAYYDIPDLESAFNDSLLKAYHMLEANPTHQLYANVLYELGAASLDQYLYDASEKAGDAALRYCEQALNSSAPFPGPKRAAAHTVLARLHLARFEYHSGAEDAEKAIEHLKQAANAYPAIEREPKHTENRARALFACYQTGREEYGGYLDEALALAQEALDRTLKESIHYPITSTFLAEILLAQHEKSRNRSDLDTALRYLEDAAQEVPFVSPDQPWVGERLARGLIARFIDDGEKEDLDDGISFLEIALNLTVSNPYRRRPRLDALGGALALRLRHFALGQSTAGDRLREARELMAGRDSM